MAGGYHTARPLRELRPNGSSASRTSPEWLVRFANFARMARPLRELRPNGSSASRTSPEWLVRFAHIAGGGVASFLTPHFSQGHGTPCHYASPPHSSPLTSHQGQPQGLPLRPSRLTPHTGTARRAPTAHPLTPTTSLLTPHSSLLTPPSSLLTPHSSLLRPHSSLLTPTTSLLTPHS